MAVQVMQMVLIFYAFTVSQYAPSNWIMYAQERLNCVLEIHGHLHTSPEFVLLSVGEMAPQCSFPGKYFGIEIRRKSDFL